MPLPEQPSLVVRPPAERVRTLTDARRVFVRHSSPRLLVVASLAALVALVAAGGWRPAQLAVGLVVLAAHPLVEWVVHVYVLHARPVRIGGHTLDLDQARKHRAHHADPRNLEILFIPMRSLVAGSAAIAALCLLLPDTSTRLALVAVAAVTTLAYEWVHFLIHTDYKPRRAAYHRLYTGHRLHHYRNENYWFGVSRRRGDRMLGTNPGKDDVPLSSTCLTLQR